MCETTESTKSNVKVYVHNPVTYELEEFKKGDKSEENERRNEEGTH